MNEFRRLMQEIDDIQSAPEPDDWELEYRKDELKKVMRHFLRVSDQFQRTFEENHQNLNDRQADQWAAFNSRLEQIKKLMKRD